MGQVVLVVAAAVVQLRWLVWNREVEAVAKVE